MRTPYFGLEFSILSNCKSCIYQIDDGPRLSAVGLCLVNMLGFRLSFIKINEHTEGLPLRNTLLSFPGGMLVFPVTFSCKNSLGHVLSRGRLILLLLASRMSGGCSYSAKSVNTSLEEEARRSL